MKHEIDDGTVIDFQLRGSSTIANTSTEAYGANNDHTISTEGQMFLDRGEAVFGRVSISRSAGGGGPYDIDGANM